MKMIPIKGAPLLLSVALVTVTAVALVAFSPEAFDGAGADVGTLVIPEGTEILDVSPYITQGVTAYTVLVEDTSDGSRYVLQYDRPFRREVRPSWAFRTQGEPMEELTR